MQYCSLRHRTSFLPADTSTNEWHICFGPAASFFLELLVIALCSSSVSYCASWRFFLWHIFFAFSYSSLGSRGKSTEVVWHSFLQWTTFCQTSPPVGLGWPCTAWLITSLSYTELWSMWSFWLSFCNVVFVLGAVGL